jgi:hypothetical protein
MAAPCIYTKTVSIQPLIYNYNRFSFLQISLDKSFYVKGCFSENVFAISLLFYLKILIVCYQQLLKISEMMAFSWSRCIICQKDTSEELRCPLRSRGADKSDPRSMYNSFLQNVSEFRDSLDVILTVSLTLPLELSVDALIENEAAWHKSCHLQFSKSELNKAKERAAGKRKLDQAKPEQEKPTKPVYCPLA